MESVVSMNQIPDRNEIRDIVRELLTKQTATQPQTAIPNEPIDESYKTVITEAEIKNLQTGASLLIREDAIITPSAQDLIQQQNIQIVHRKAANKSAKQRIIAVGTDHGGFEMKGQLKTLLTDLGYQVRDFGTNSAEAVDYPDFAFAVANAVAEGTCDLGIILDGAGIGSCMTANKVPGIRAAMCYDEATAKNSREHNYANVLTLGAKMISPEKMREIVRAWLNTDEGEARHGKRVAKIMAIEKQYLSR